VTRQFFDVSFTSRGDSDPVYSRHLADAQAATSLADGAELDAVMENPAPQITTSRPLLTEAISS
jgi:hypothetical protein